MARRPVLPYLETHVVDHCNLNCKACSHFSPLSKESFVDVLEFEKNLELLSKKIRFKKIRLLGGEPLLHPEMSRFVEISRKYFPRSEISIVTNGSLLFSLPDSFFQACRQNNISFDRSKYPAFEDKFEEMKALIFSKGIKISDIHECDKMYVFHNPNGDSDINSSFKHCGMKKYKILKAKKLYTCPKSAYINLFTEYFKMPILKDFGYSLCFYSAKELIRRLDRPIDTCKYCTYGARKIDWEKSKMEKSDWDVIDDPNKIKLFQKHVLSDIEKQS